jgi:hypothetical protein
VARRAVKTGNSTVTQVQVTAGLAEGDAVAMPTDVPLADGVPRDSLHVARRGGRPPRPASTRSSVAPTVLPPVFCFCFDSRPCAKRAGRRGRPAQTGGLPHAVNRRTRPEASCECRGIRKDPTRMPQRSISSPLRLLCAAALGAGLDIRRLPTGATVDNRPGGVHGLSPPASGGGAEDHGCRSAPALRHRGGGQWSTPRPAPSRCLAAGAARLLRDRIRLRPDESRGWCGPRRTATFSWWRAIPAGSACCAAWTATATRKKWRSTPRD